MLVPRRGRVPIGRRLGIPVSLHFSYPVETEDRVIGLLCLRDLLRTPAGQRDSVSVQGAMRMLSPNLVVGPDQPPITRQTAVRQLLAR